MGSRSLSHVSRPGRQARVRGRLNRLLDIGELRLEKWMKRVSTSRCCRTARRERSSSRPNLQHGWRGRPTTSSRNSSGPIRSVLRVSALLPTPDPAAAADELERIVTRLGLKGAMVHGLTNGLFLDDKRFWPIFERAQALDVPIYLHPSFPHPVVVDAYYKDYLPPIRAYRSCTGIYGRDRHARRAIGDQRRVRDIRSLSSSSAISGEGIPFLLWRITSRCRAHSSPAFQIDSFAQLLSDDQRQFLRYRPDCSITEMGIDRIMFSVDWPFIANRWRPIG